MSESKDVDQKNYSCEVDTGKIELKRTIGVGGGAGLIFGCIVGSGIFISPALVLQSTGSVGFFIISWVVCGLIAICGGLCFAELGTSIPKSGAEYNYIYDSFGPLMAFMYLWTSMMCIKPASVTIIALSCALYASEPFFPNQIVPEILLKLIAAFVIFIVTILNVLSVKWAIRINNILNYSKTICILLILGIGIYSAAKGGYSNFSEPFKNTSISAGKISAAFFYTLWAFDGWNNLNYAAEEMKEPEVTMPRSIMLGLSFVTISYVLINIAYVIAIGGTEILRSNAVALTVGQQYLGSAAWVIPIFVAFSTFGSANSTIFSNGRLLFVAGREGHLPLLLSSIHRRLHTPIPSLIFTMLMSLVYLIPKSDDIGALIDFFSFTSWLFFGLCFFSLIYLRFTKPELHRPYKVWIIVPIFMLLVSVALIILPIINDWKGSLIATGVVLVSIPVYFIFIHFGNKLPKWFSSSFDSASNFIMGIYDLTVATKEEDLG